MLLSRTAVWALRRNTTASLRGISSKAALFAHFHSSNTAQMRGGTSEQIPAQWLRQIMKDDTEPPRLYAWTLRHLSPHGTGSGAGAVGKRGCEGHEPDDDDAARRRIYILGVGNIGRLYAMCLSKLDPRPPITLVVHRRELLEHWAADPGIELRTRHGEVQRSADFDIEWWTEQKPPPMPASSVNNNSGDETENKNERESECQSDSEVAGGLGSKINNIIIATKASDAMPQVDRLRRYLGSESTVAFAQNGMCKLWPPLGETYVRARFPDKGPNWIACVTTHGVYSTGIFKSVHAAPATALVGPVMVRHDNGGEEEKKEKEDDYLMRQIAAAPGLDARAVSKKDLWVAQLEKLVVNMVINPLTAVLRCKNGELFTFRDDGGGDDGKLSMSMSIVIDQLLREASTALCALIADPGSDDILLSGSGDPSYSFQTSNPSNPNPNPNPNPDPNTLVDDATPSRRRSSSSSPYRSSSPQSQSQSLEEVRKQLLDRFSFPQLRETVLDVGEKVAENTSSMLQDMRAGKTTEIDDMNGWLVDTARILALRHAEREGKGKGKGKDISRDIGLPTHEKLIELVKMRTQLTRRELCARLLQQQE